MTPAFDKEYPAIPEFRRVGVIGAGQMGGGIAQVAATAGFEVDLMDVSADQLAATVEHIGKLLARQVAKEVITDAQRQEALARIQTSTALDSLGRCDLVIEAATENEPLKRKILVDLLPLIKADAVLASNTSSISITRLAAQTDRPGRFIGMHFMNPVPAMKLVEIIRGIATDEDTYQAVRTLAIKLGKNTGHGRGFPGVHRQPDLAADDQRGGLHPLRGCRHRGEHRHGHEAWRQSSHGSARAGRFHRPRHLSGRSCRCSMTGSPTASTVPARCW